jgi:hypothetical protein
VRTASPKGAFSKTKGQGGIISNSGPKAQTNSKKKKIWYKCRHQGLNPFPLPQRLAHWPAAPRARVLIKRAQDVYIEIKDRGKAKWQRGINTLLCYFFFIYHSVSLSTRHSLSVLSSSARVPVTGEGGRRWRHRLLRRPSSENKPK